MSDKIRVSAKTKEDAITKALIQLHTTSDHLSYSVLVEGKMVYLESVPSHGLSRQLLRMMQI